jgi:hypothetical protein
LEDEDNWRAERTARVRQPKEGLVTDKSTRMVLAALSRAAAAPEGSPLFAIRGGLGLFPAAPAGRQAAQRCQDEGWLRVLSAESDVSAPLPSSASDTAVLVRKKSKPTTEICHLTDKGLAWLLSQTSPREVLEDFIRALEARQAEALELLSALQRMQTGFDALKVGAEKVLERMSRPEDGAATESLLERFQRFHQGQADDARPVLLAHMKEWQSPDVSGDCPLPELFRRSQTGSPSLTIGAFHDALRRLHDAGLVYLHPWTGPLHALPEPSFALLVGHEIAYYVSLKK